MQYRFTKHFLEEHEPLDRISLQNIKSGDQIILTLEESEQNLTELELIIKNIAQLALPATALAISEKYNWKNLLVILHGSWTSRDGNEFYSNELLKDCYPEIEWIDQALAAKQEKEWSKKGTFRAGDVKWTRKNLNHLYPEKEQQQAIVNNLIGKRRELFPKITKITKVGV